MRMALLVPNLFPSITQEDRRRCRGLRGKEECAQGRGEGREGLCGQAGGSKEDGGEGQREPQHRKNGVRRRGNQVQGLRGQAAPARGCGKQAPDGGDERAGHVRGLCGHARSHAPLQAAGCKGRAEPRGQADRARQAQRGGAGHDHRHQRHAQLVQV